MACGSPAPQPNPYANGVSGSGGVVSQPAPTSGTGGGDSGVAGSFAGGGVGGDPAVTGGSAGTSGSAGSGGDTAGSGGTSGSGGGSGITNPGRQPAVPDANGIYGHPDPTATYPTYAGFTPYLIEEFNAPIDLDTDPFWTYGDGALFEGMNRMVKENVAFSGGNLTLSLTEQEQLGGYSFSAADNVATKPLSSGELRTVYNNFRYGRYEVRMKAPATGENFIFTMFAYRHPAYLLWREIDIEVQASPQNTFISNLITAPPGTRLWNSSIEDSTTTYPYGDGNPIPGGFNTASDYHVYAFEWLPDSIKWYVDGVLVRTKIDGVGNDNLPVPKESTKIVMNLWVFTSAALGGGDPASNVYPITGNYDWFRFYRWDQDTTYPCADAPGCLPAADLELAKNNVDDGLPDIRPALCTGALGMLDTACGP